VQRGLKPEQIPQVARDYYEAFRTKCAIFGPPEKVIAVFCAGFVLENALVASCGDEVAGVAGFKSRGQPLIQLQLMTMIRQLGLFRALLGYLIARLFDEKPARGELLMDGIFVSERYRGRGIGNLLLHAICDLAREQGLTQVRLRVVDTNPNARRLYERVGFVGRSEARHPWFQRLLGFGSVTTMVKILS
jgi:ribosomal protein S18 acetylase RimI-like enzyme